MEEQDEQRVVEPELDGTTLPPEFSRRHTSDQLPPKVDG